MLESRMKLATTHTKEVRNIALWASAPRFWALEISKRNKKGTCIHECYLV